MKNRIITGFLLGLLVLLGIFLLNNTTFNIVVIVILLLAAWEWSHMANLKKIFSRILYVFITAILLMISIYFVFAVLLISVVFWLLCCIIIYNYSSKYSSIKTILPKWRYIMGFIVLVPFLTAINILHNSSEPLLLIMVLITVSLADSAAYFIGKKYGKYYLALQISPTKTIEGLLAGIIVGGIAGVLNSLFIYATFTQHVLLIILNFIIILIALLGDLFESMIKRICNIKDSGKLLPGHGGILDRLDSLLASVPFFVSYVILIGLISI